MQYFSTFASPLYTFAMLSQLHLNTYFLCTTLSVRLQSIEKFFFVHFLSKMTEKIIRRSCILFCQNFNNCQGKFRHNINRESLMISCPHLLPHWLRQEQFKKGQDLKFLYFFCEYCPLSGCLIGSGKIS